MFGFFLAFILFSLFSVRWITFARQKNQKRHTATQCACAQRITTLGQHHVIVVGAAATASHYYYFRYVDVLWVCNAPANVTIHSNNNQRKLNTVKFPLNHYIVFRMFFLSSSFPSVSSCIWVNNFRCLDGVLHIHRHEYIYPNCTQNTQCTNPKKWKIKKKKRKKFRSMCSPWIMPPLCLNYL